jgi:transmembrane sensor
MPISKEQIARYLAGNSQEEEHRQVAAYLQQYPEKLEELLDEQGWGEELILPEEQSRRMLAGIQQQTGKVRKYTVWASVAAAALAGTIALGWYTYDRSSPVPLKPVAQETTSAPDPVVMMQEVRVYQRADSVLVLPDGSRATLKQHTVIRYDTAFDHGHRALYLEGEGVFDVAKRAALPFTVNSGAVSTTALGTVFSVSAWENTHQVKVRLMSGKVVVTSKGQKSTYLQPGQELAWSEGAEEVAVYAYRQPAKPAAVKVVPVNSTVQINGDHIEFVKCPVEEVFEVLRKAYGVTIIANVVDLKGCFFSGALSSEKEINDIIETIATLNQLVVMQDESGYHISK